jgi:hypothetical protein
MSEPRYLSGGKRTHIAASEWIDDWWVGFGKDESCQFEGPWHHMANLAARILAHPNTEKVAPALYCPGLDDLIEEEFTYSNYRDLPKDEATTPKDGARE